jgi:hypothetical protein
VVLEGGGQRSCIFLLISSVISCQFDKNWSGVLAELGSDLRLLLSIPRE